MRVGIRSSLRGNSYFVADLAVACSPPRPGEKFLPDPLLLAEVLSPYTERSDRRTKLPDYRVLLSVQEILLLDPERPYAEIHRRAGEDRWITELLREPTSTLRLESIGLTTALGTLYPTL